MEAVRRLLLRAEVRLLTLTGAGGTGKTRLALQVAAELLGAFADGVFFVDLAAIADPVLVAGPIADTLGVSGVGDQPLLERVEQALGGLQVLLVLDNFEQLLAAGPQVAQLLASCPGLKMLVTSRAALQLRWEHRYDVLPLELPDPAHPSDPGALAGYPAVALFVARARAVEPDFALSADNAALVAQICMRLDGLPLAIELVAARIRLLPPAAMLERLGRRLPLLVGGPRDAPTRQRSLGDTIDWSYDLLGVEEQRMLRRLAAFVGGCSLEAAGVVCTTGDDRGLDLLGALASLEAQSLLRQEDAGGESRVKMLETIHEYALGRLEASGECEAIRCRHAEYYLALAEEAEPNLRGTDQARWLTRLEREHDNLRSALAWAEADPRRAALGLRLAAALGWFWYVRGHFSEGRRWLGRALDACGDVPADVRAKALAGAGILAHGQGDCERAAVRFEASLALYRESGDTPGIAAVLAALGLIAYEQGDHARAGLLQEESLRLRRELGDRHGTALALNSLGNVRKGEGRYLEARALYQESLGLLREVGDRRGLSIALHNLGLVALREGEHERAARLLEESLTVARELGDKRAIAWPLHYLGRVAAALGEFGKAADLHQESLALRRDLGDKRGIAECLEGLAAVAAARGQSERAARLSGAASALREAIGIPLVAEDRADRDGGMAAARAGLGEDAFVAAWETGRAASVNGAIADALAPASPDAPGAPVRRAPPPGGQARAAGRPSTPGRGLHVLTRREREVASLMARGLTYRQIAAELVIAEGTVGVHAEHILSKLGFHSRAQVAAWVAEQGPLPAPTD